MKKIILALLVALLATAAAAQVLPVSTSPQVKAGSGISIAADGTVTNTQPYSSSQASSDLSTVFVTPSQATNAAQAAIASNLSGPISMVSGSTVGGAGIVTTPGLTTGAPATGLTYLHRYSNVTLTVPAVAIGGTGTGTALVTGTAVGDQCFVAPTSTTTALSYIMGAGWVSTAGTVKVALAAPSLIAISSGSVTVNMLCAQ